MIEHHNTRSAQQFHPALRILIGFFIIISILFPTPMIPSVHAEITLDGSMGPSGALAGPNYAIGHDLGRLKGTNLFHSFGRFNVAAGESATFTGPNTIENVIGRVTGGTASSIDGLLRSTIQDANLFLINPSGVMFGPNATLDVNGSFHVSTADYLKLSDGGVFYADPSRNSVLTVAPPFAFGFLGDSPAAITIDGSSLQVPDGETLSVVGGDIEIVSGALSADRINLASVASGGEVIFNNQDQEQRLNVDTFESLGKINISQGGELSIADSLPIDGDPPGNIFIRGDSLALNGSTIGSYDSDIDIKVVGDLILTNESRLDAHAFWSLDGSANILLDAGRLTLSDGSIITTDNYSQIYGPAGDITIKAAENVYLSSSSDDPWRQSYISSTTHGSGRGGTISIFTPSLTIDDHARISTEAWPVWAYSNRVPTADGGVGTGNAGDIFLDVGNLTIRNAGIDSSTMFWTSGQAGHINIRAAESIFLSEKSYYCR